MASRIRENPVAMAALAELERGARVTDVAARFGVNERKVRRWREAWRRPEKPRRVQAPSCLKCKLIHVCNESVRNGGAFARSECNEIDPDLAFCFVADRAEERQRLRRVVSGRLW